MDPSKEESEIVSRTTVIDDPAPTKPLNLKAPPVRSDSTKENNGASVESAIDLTD